MRSGREWQKLYWNYTKKYNEELRAYQKKFKTDSKSLPGGAKYDYWGYRNAYAGIEATRLSQQEEGLRGKNLNVQRDLIHRQKYGLSYKQGASYTKAIRQKLREELKGTKSLEKKAKIKEQLKNIKLENIRTKPKEVEAFKQYLSDVNSDLKAQGLDSYARAQWISEEIFGSPHTA